MKRAVALLLWGATTAHAAVSPQAAGARLALHGAGSVRACATCHGARGQGRAHFAYPRLAGLGVRYLFSALRSFADGRRLNGIMTPIARRLSVPEMHAVAQYYAGFAPRPPRVARPRDRVRLAHGRHYYEHGDLAEHVVACARCHGPRGHGLGARFPWIAGQPRGYLKAELRSFRAGARRGGLGLMRAAARPLTDRQINDVAFYVSVLGARPRLRVPVRSSSMPLVAPRAFVPPRRDAIPPTLFGDAVLRGRAIFDHTGRYARPFVGNALSCGDCHLGEGREADAGPLWAAAALFPRPYRGRMTTLAARIQAAFVQSENGRAPPPDSVVLTDLLAYVHWMSRGEAIGARTPGRGYPPVAAPARGPDIGRGAMLYAQQCAVCHGGQGQGRQYNARLIFPPVWGPRSFGQRASLAQKAVLAAFLRSTMPYADPGSLTAGAAYDLAAFLDAQPRPR